MHTKNRRIAHPPSLFVSDKRPDTVISDVLQIFQHTHTIFGAVPFIEMPQPSAGVRIAL